MKILNKDNFLHDISIEKNYKSSLKILNQTGIEYKNDYLKNKKKYFCVPSIYAIALNYYSQKNNLFAKLLRKFFKKNKSKFIIKNKKYIKIFELRSELLNENIKMLKKNNLSNGLYKFGWILK